MNATFPLKVVSAILVGTVISFILSLALCQTFPQNWLKVMHVLKNFNCHVPQLERMEDFFNYGSREKMQCKELVSFGGSEVGDGSKLVCLDEKFKLIPKQCVVLSFGINNEWSFDDAMDKLGCTVYAFDPTMEQDNFNRSEKIHFFNLGLSNFKGILQIKDKQCKVDRYDNILKMLGLTEVSIDYLKIDIEGSEMQVFEDIFYNSPQLLKNVKQIAMEIHPDIPPLLETEEELESSSFNGYWELMHLLECHGFKLLHYEKNQMWLNHYKWGNRIESICYEGLWGNTVFKF